MLNQPFEGFLANLFCQSIELSNSLNTKYHFVSSNPTQSIKLYNGFKSLGFKELFINNAPLKYVETSSGKKIIVMLHHLGVQDRNSSHEDYIASVRDALNDIDNAILFLINNSSLETLTSTFADVSADNGIFTPKSINQALLDLGTGHKNELIFNYLVSNKQRQIDEENLSIFGYEPLYKSIHKDHIDIQEYGFFPEPRIYDIDNEKHLARELDRNIRLARTVHSLVNDFGDELNELQRQLQDLGFSERYIEDKFIQNKNLYKTETFSNIEAEIEKNKLRKLNVKSIDINGSTLEEWKHSSGSASANRCISLIGEVEVGLVEIKFKLERGEPVLKTEQILVNGDFKQSQILITTSNNENHSILTVRIPFDGKPSFIQIKIKRESQRECFQFNCCLVSKCVFFLSNYFEKLEVEFKRNKGSLVIENIQGKLLVNSNNNLTHIFSNENNKINCDDLKYIDFSTVSENEILGEMILFSGEYYLPVTIIGPKIVETIILPSLFDTQRSIDIFENDRIPKYKSETSRVIIGGREKDLTVQAKELCVAEFKMISEGLLYFDDSNGEEIQLNGFEIEFPEVSRAYKKLFTWLLEHETILSITNWPESLIRIIEQIISTVHNELVNIPQGALNYKSRQLLTLGIIRRSNREFFSPFHPLCLSYALEFAKSRIADLTNSFSQIPSSTVKKFNASGLLPILFDNESIFVRTKSLSHNKFWLELGPSSEGDTSYVSSLVYEKIQDFISCFDVLFKDNKQNPLIINSINNQNNADIFNGILNYYKKNKKGNIKIQVNIYNDDHSLTLFDDFSEGRSVLKLRELARLNSSDKESEIDDLILRIRRNVTFYKIDNYEEFNYAHLSFFKNNEEVVMRTNSVGEGKSGIVCNGILSGEASYLENEVFYTGFGLKNLITKNSSVCLASLYNQLMLPYRDSSAKYVKGSVPVLAVKDSFKHKLNKSYNSSIWTCIIEPKVTLEFFDTKETILIHYADQYTNSVAYDAITVSSRVGLYKDLLRSHSDELINSFNALNGQWLLDVVKESGKQKSDNTKKKIKEKKGIVAAYKFISGLLLSSDIVWIPLSVGEMLRVTGNLGLQIKDNDFSARLHNKSKGALSDDILFVGIKGGRLVLLPLEVKTRASGTDFTKAVKQSKSLAEHMKRLLAPKTFKGQVYRSLFIQQLLTQVDKFELYGVFPVRYFENLYKISDSLLQGEYNICELPNYPEGIALSITEEMERSRIESVFDVELNVLKLRIPHGFVKMLHEESIEKLSSKFQDESAYPEISHLNFLNAELTSFNVFELPYDISSRNEIVDDDIIFEEERNVSNVEEELNTSEVNNEGQFKAIFGYDDSYSDIVDKILGFYQRDIQIEDILSLTEMELKNSGGFNSYDILSFYKLKYELSHDSLIEKQNELVNIEDESPCLNMVNITNDYKALVSTILREFGENITIKETIAIATSSLESIPGFGKKKIHNFLNLVEHLKNGSFSINSDINKKQIEDFDLPIEELEQFIINDLNNNILNVRSRENDILIRRYGINCDGETLEDIGKSYDITRERVRQIESKAKNNFIAKLSISPKVIWAITKSNLSELRTPLFTTLRGSFSSDKGFYSFLEACCGLKENEIKLITSPSLNKSFFEEFWLWNKSPADLDDLSWYLHERLNVELAVAENQIAIWEKENILQINGEKIKPLALSKVPGITNALLDFPDGDVWANIQSHANKKSICSGIFSEDRLEPNLMRAVDREYVYQSGRGTYRHIDYLKISEDDKKRVLCIIASKLNEYKYCGRDAVNLSVDIYQQVDLADDYYFVRHIVRAYGESYGIYFNGKSGADTVSLASDFNLASQKSVLIDLFKQSLSPLSKLDVASKIRSQSIGHASFYIDKLLTDGIVVRIDETTYAHVDNAFIGVDIENIMKMAIDFIDNEPRIIEASKLQSSINRRLDINYNKYLYISLLKAYATDYGKNYFFVQNLISSSNINYTGLTDLCRTALDLNTSRVSALEYLNEKLCIHEHILKRCLEQVYMASSDKSNHSGLNIFNDNKIISDEVKEEKFAQNLPSKEKEVERFLKKDIDKCRVLIGLAIDNLKPVYWEYGNKSLANRHLIIFGRSGQGKSYCIQGLLMELAKNKINSMVIDYTNGFLPEHLEEEFMENVKPITDLVVQTPLKLNPFNKQTQKVAGITIADKAHDVASRVASVFNAVYSDIGSQQLQTLIKILEDGIELYGAEYNFNRMLRDLEDAGKHGEALANKLHSIVRANLFSFASEMDGWKDIFESTSSTTRLIQLARLSRDVWLLATEFILWDLYSYVCANGDKNTPIPVVLDEVQNLDQKLDSPLGKMLTEGRKYGLSLILATQTLSNLKRDEQDRLFQAAHKLFFAPAETEIQSYAKLLEQAVPGSNKKNWLTELAKLKKGECISVGLHINENGHLEQSAKVLKVSSLGNRKM
ncbi:DNA phosphorothioation-dependent restriction protein DptH [Enterobacter bugandensis]|uniref:DNA phosphorothioation-dependent restriction protein DptH n=3 Tax=Enterobacter TaxID=547 RepID=UPI002FD86203